MKYVHQHDRGGLCFEQSWLSIYLIYFICEERKKKGIGKEEARKGELPPNILTSHFRSDLTRRSVSADCHSGTTVPTSGLMYSCNEPINMILREPFYDVMSLASLWSTHAEFDHQRASYASVTVTNPTAVVSVVVTAQVCSTRYLSLMVSWVF